MEPSRIRLIISPLKIEINFSRSIEIWGILGFPVWELVKIVFTLNLSKKAWFRSKLDLQSPLSLIFP